MRNNAVHATPSLTLLKKGTKLALMTLEEKAEIALKYFRKSGTCTKVKFVGKWRGEDVFRNTTPEKTEEIAVGRPYSVIIDDTGNTTGIAIEAILFPDFP